MFSEFLRIKPVLDPATSKRMEQSLAKRFMRVAKTFGGALKATLKGAGVGIILTLISKLLNPISELEERLRTLLGEGSDLADVAEKYGATPGEVTRLQNVATTVGLKPEELAKLLDSFGEAVETAREELASGKELSEKSLAVKEFTDRENIVTAFQDALKGLKQVGEGGTRLIPLDKDAVPQAGQRVVTTDQGRFIELTAAQRREQLERLVFGGRFIGGARRLVDTDIEATANKYGNPSIERINNATGRLAELSNLQRGLEAASKTRELVTVGENTTAGIVKTMEARADKERQDDAKKLNEKAYADLAVMAGAVNEILTWGEWLKTKVFEGVSNLVRLVENFDRVIERLPSWLGGGKKGR